MRVLMVGLGDIARKAYLPVLSSRGDVELHVATRDPAVRAQVARDHRLTHHHASLDAALAASRFDAAFVHAATPAHPELVAALLERGVPTFVDKPLADTLAAAQALVETAVRRGTPLAVGFNRRFAPDYAALRGRGASLITLEKHRHRQPDRARRVVFDDFIHVVDTLLFLAPAPVQRQLIVTQVAGGLLHAITLTLAGEGFSAVGTMHRDSGLDEERLDVIGAGERHSVLDLAERVDSAGTQVRRRRGDWTAVARQRGFDAMCDDFLAAARERRPTDAAAILRTHALCEEIVRDAEAKG
ncbi:Gfo/Idh/MocA family oxidoreductase [Sphingomonas sp. RHCKR7]|uniref:Gfo/Idh/MocA family protein n=1 Tax=Sphingomonas folli TaxID=2862497 RepID=UPI001C674E82|nr:Gfo/Idh/MocA family oxidoreductase [Sphingomonas folli]MBW6528740.1 Gfo/Idh/MocA family oxidoreductase [Sphingomonas folli]